MNNLAAFILFSQFIIKTNKKGSLQNKTQDVTLTNYAALDHSVTLHLFWFWTVKKIAKLACGRSYRAHKPHLSFKNIQTHQRNMEYVTCCISELLKKKPHAHSFIHFQHHLSSLCGVAGELEPLPAVIGFMNNHLNQD